MNNEQIIKPPHPTSIAPAQAAVMSLLYF